MAKFQYDFDRKPSDMHRKRGVGKGLRLLIVFCIVAAVTAAVIFALIPDKSAETTGGDEKKTGTNEKVSSGGEVSDKKDDTGKIAPTAPEKQTGTVSDENADIQAVPAGNGKEAESAAVAPQQNLVKGVAGNSDPVPEKDRAVYRKNGLEHSLSEIEALENMVDPVEAGVKAAAFLKREAAAGGVNSENWARAGRILANSVRWREKNSNLGSGAEVYKVVSGDALARIARRKYTTVEGIKWMNKR